MTDASHPQAETKGEPSLGWWELRLRDFLYVGLVLLIAIAVTVLIGSFARRHAEDRVSLPVAVLP